jgi:hypothetical protein
VVGKMEIYEKLRREIEAKNDQHWKDLGFSFVLGCLCFTMIGFVMRACSSVRRSRPGCYEQLGRLDEPSIESSME